MMEKKFCLQPWYIRSYGKDRETPLSPSTKTQKEKKEKSGLCWLFFINQFKGLCLLEAVRNAECLRLFQRRSNIWALQRLPNNLGHCYWNSGQSKKRAESYKTAERAKCVRVREKKDEKGRKIKSWEGEDRIIDRED